MVKIILRFLQFIKITGLFVILSSCSDDDDKTSFKRDLSDSSDANIRTLVHNGTTREYILYVPDSYDGSSAVPLLMNFHGFGGVISEYISWADMRPLADAENFILVYPQGGLLDGSTHWNAGLESPDNKSESDDFGFVEALIDEIGTSYTIDLNRVYACGYSNGGFFSYSLACYHGDKIAAIGAVASTMIEETMTNCSPSHPTAVINVHGTSDDVVPYDGAEGLKPIEEVLDYWVSFNNASSEPVTNSINENGTTVEYYFYSDGDNDTSVEHYLVVDGGHVWFDISYEGNNTSCLLWNFLSRYDINGLR